MEQNKKKVNGVLLGFVPSAAGDEDWTNSLSSGGRSPERLV